MPTPTSVVMAPILARQICKLQDSPFHKGVGAGAPQALQEKPIVTLLQAEAWRKGLAPHNDREWVAALVSGMQHEFRIGLREAPQCRTSTATTPSACEHAEVVDQYFQAQVSKGYMAGPFTSSECSGVVASSIAVIPKKEPGKFHIIVDMSSPNKGIINDNIRKQHTHVAYSSEEDAAHLMQHFGTNALLAKIDVKEAYRIIPIDPDDRPFLGRGRCTSIANFHLA